jgi:hypothetical protein
MEGELHLIAAVRRNAVVIQHTLKVERRALSKGFALIAEKAETRDQQEK